MTVLFETTEAALGASTIYTLTEGDSFQGSIVIDDSGDSVLADLVAGQSYTFTLTTDGLPDSLSLSYSNGSDTGSVSGGFVTGDLTTTFVLTFTPLASGPYTISVLSNGGITYSLLFGSLPPVLPTGATEGDDILAGATSADVINLLDGADSMNGAGGSDRIDGGAGDDTLLGEAGNDQLSGDTGADQLFGGSGRDTLDGGADNDLLDGGGNDDALSGGDGDDILSGDSGNDLLTGGAGADVFIFRNGFGQDTISDFTTGTDLIDLRGTGVWASFQLTISSTETDTIVTLADGASLTLQGVQNEEWTSADFLLDSPPPADVPSNGADLLIGTSGNDILSAGGGSDVVQGGLGLDQLFGGSGNDTLAGDEGRDTLDGGSGADVLYGGGGNDDISGGTGNDLILGGIGLDTINGGANNDTIYGDSGDDRLNGDKGNDLLFGGTGSDLILGDTGNDTLEGGSNNDTLDGGAGDDRLTGGAGADIFRFNSSMNTDRITDFEDGLDLIDIAAFGASNIDGLTITQIGTATEIRFSPTQAITLDNLDASLIDITDFILVPTIPEWVAS